MRLIDLATALSPFNLPCELEVVQADEDHGVTFSVRVKVPHGFEFGSPLAVLSLGHELQYLRDLDQMRLLCERYGIPQEKLERYINRRADDDAG